MRSVAEYNKEFMGRIPAAEGGDFSGWRRRFTPQSEEESGLFM